MLYFTICEQSKRGGKVQVYESTPCNTLHSSVSKQLTIMYQYSIYEEGVDWSCLSSKMTEQEFDNLFEKGQRIFWLETNDDIFTVKIENWEEVVKSTQDIKQQKIDLSLFNDLKVYCFNYVDGFYNFDEFNKLVRAYEDLELDKDKKVFDLRIKSIQNEIDKRMENRLA